ncbi:Protein OPI10 [Penicillium rolfsii]|nr:Protein OPI10 [Penicillium rolfsii]
MFSVVIPGRPCLTDIVAVDGQATKFAFTIPLNPSFTELVVFFLPGTVLPPNTGAAIYIQLPDPNTGNPTDFRFIGALANEKPSGIFKIQSSSQANNGSSEAEQEDQMLDEGSGNPAGGANLANGVATLGISIEPAQNIAPQLSALQAESARNEPSSSTALIVQTPEQRQQKQITTKVLAQRIIGSAFNFLASFAESDPSNKGHEVVPLKSFRDWWTKFERRIDMDPAFLERADPNAT